MNKIIVRQLGQQPYQPVVDAMHQFTQTRNQQTPDEIWLVQHDPVFTQGKAGRAEHVLDAGDIPVIHSDRGGQVTYHGPGQQIMYVMVDLKRAKRTVKTLVHVLEKTVIGVLAQFGIEGETAEKAPGVYVHGAKISSLGLHISRGCSLHGLSFNVDMDLTPFKQINPCGYAGMQVTQLRDFTSDIIMEQVQTLLIQQFCHEMELIPIWE